MRKLLVIVSVLTLALVAASCGSSGSDGAEKTTTTKADPAPDDGATTTTGGRVEPTRVTADEYVAAFTKGMTAGSKDGGNLVLSKEQAACVAPKFVDLATVKAMNEAGITAEDAADPGFDPSNVGLDEDQGQALVDAYGECDFDIYGELATALTTGLSKDIATCTSKNLDHDLADALLVKTFSSGKADAEFEALLADLQATCDLPAN